MTPSLQCASMLMSLSLRRVTFALHKEETDEGGDKKGDESDVTELEVSE